MDSMKAFGEYEASTSLFSSGSATSIVNRIRERLLQLEAEQQALRIAQEELAHMQQHLKQASKQRNSLRRAYLSSIQARHVVERELWNVKDSTERLREEIARNKQELALAEQELETVNKDWDEGMHGMHAKHQVRILLYQRFVEDYLRKKEERKNRRQNKIHVITRQAELLAEQQHAMEQEVQRLEAQLGVPESSECDTTSTTAEQIRAALQERTLIRKSLQEAQSANQRVNDIMARLEQEWFSMTNPAA